MSFTLEVITNNSPYIGGKGIMGYQISNPSTSNFTIVTSGTSLPTSITTTGYIPLTPTVGALQGGYCLLAGSYTITVTENATGDVQSIPFIITDYPETFLIDKTLTQPGCSGEGSLTFSYNTGEFTSMRYCIKQATPFCTYYPTIGCNDGVNELVINKGEIVTISPLAPGSYCLMLAGTVSAIGAGGLWSVSNPSCNITTQYFVIDEPVTANLIITTASENTICDTEVGSITVTSIDGSGSYTYLWSGPDSYSSTNANISLLASGVYTLVVTDTVTGCTGTTSVTISSIPDENGCIDPVICYKAVNCNSDCYGTATYYFTGSQIASLSEYTINGLDVDGEVIDPAACWTIMPTDPSESNPSPPTGCYAASIFLGYNKIFSSCEKCKPVDCPVEPPFERTKQDPVKIFYEIRESKCDITATKQFATAYSNMLKKVKYGIADCCNGLNIAETWVNKQVSNLQATIIPGYNCSDIPMNGCSWLPLQGCEILSTPTDGTSILVIAGEDLVYAKLVMLLSDGKAYLNQPLVTSTYQRAIGFTTMDVQMNQSTRVLVNGIITNPAWSLATGAVYFAAPNGDITSTIPTTGISQAIGIAINATTLFVDLKQPNIL